MKELVGDNELVLGSLALCSIVEEYLRRETISGEDLRVRSVKVRTTPVGSTEYRFMITSDIEEVVL